MKRFGLFVKLVSFLSHANNNNKKKKIKPVSPHFPNGERPEKLAVVKENKESVKGEWNKGKEKQTRGSFSSSKNKCLKKIS